MVHRGRRVAALDPRLSEPIRLSHRFLGTSIAVMAVVVLVQSWLHAGWLREDMLDTNSDSAERIARHIHAEVLKHFRPRLHDNGPSRPPEAGAAAGGPGAAADFDPSLLDFAAKPELGAFSPLSPGELRQLDRIVREASEKFEIVNVYIFDNERSITYSTHLQDAGFKIGANPYYDRALAGEVASVIVDRGSPVDVSRARFGVALLETYVPVYAPGDASRPVGVIEIYQDASEFEQSVTAGLVHIGLVSLGGFAALVIASWLIVRKAQRHLDRRTNALITTNAELTELSLHLEAEVEKRGRMLSQAETLASVGSLAAGVAHEINNPIATIASCSEGLIRKEATGRLDSGRLREYLGLIKEEAYRVKGITRNLLNFARPGSADFAPLDPRAPLEATLAILEFRARELDVSLELEPSSEELGVLGDANELRQLFLNITLNALDAARRGGRIRWRGRRAGAEVLLECVDDGCGIEAGEAARIFEPFYSTKSEGHGTGLGMSISQGIMSRHGGELTVQSAPGVGTTVRLSFPCLAAAKEPR